MCFVENHVNVAGASEYSDECDAYETDISDTAASDKSFSRYQTYEFSKESAPPLNLRDAVGRVVLYDNWLTGFNGKSVNGSHVHEMNVRIERRHWNQYRSFLLKRTHGGEKLSSRRKEPSRRKIKVIKKPITPEPPTFKDLPIQQQDILNKQAEDFREVGYFIIHEVRLPKGFVQDVSSEESMSSRAATMSSSSSKTGITLMDAEVEMYESHYQSYQAAKNSFESNRFERHKAPLVKISWATLMTHATWFSPHDVRTSGCLLPLPGMCCVPHCSNTDLTACDGAVLAGIGPAAAPCQRKAICNACRKLNLYRGTDSWMCSLCLTDEASYESMYGYVTPAVNSVSLKPDVRALGAPVLVPSHRSKHNLAKWYAHFTSKPSSTEEKSTDLCTKEASAEIFGTALQTAGLSRKQQSIVLDSLYDLDSKGLVDLKGNIPVQPRTLLKRKEASTGKNSCNLEPVSVRFDVSGVLQGQKSVLLQRFNPLEVTQLMLMNANIPSTAYYYGDGEHLVFADGETAVGGPVWCNEAFRETCTRFPKTPANRRVLVFGFGADKTEASSHSTWPFFLKLFNVSEEYCIFATSLLGLVPVSKKRKPKGGKAEGMSEEQKSFETQVIQDSYAHILKEFEEANLNGGVVMTYKDGDFVTFFGCISNNEDLAGKKEVAATNFFHCTCCFTHPRNYGSAHETHICGSGPLGARDPKKVLKILRSICLEQSVRSLTTEAKERAAQVGLKRFAVKNQLLAFTQFFGDKGVYDCMHFDDLHMMFLGLFPLMLTLANYLFCKYYKRTSAVKTVEDVRQLIEVLLMCIPKMNDGKHRLLLFLSGWWTIDAWSGKHLESFFVSLLYIFGTNDALIYDAGVRLEFAEIVRTAYSIYRKVKVKTTYRQLELEELKIQIQDLELLMARMFSIQVNSEPDVRTLDELTVLDPKRARKDIILPSKESNEKHQKKGVKQTSKQVESSASTRVGVSLEETVANEEDEVPPVTLTSENEIKGKISCTLKVHSHTGIPRTLRRLGGAKAPSTQQMESEHPFLKQCYKGTNLQVREDSDRQVLIRYLALNVLKKAIKKPHLGYRAQRLLEVRLQALRLNDGSEEDEEDAAGTTSSKEVLLVTKNAGTKLLKRELECADFDAHNLIQKAVQCLSEAPYQDMSHRLLLKAVQKEDGNGILRKAVVICSGQHCLLDDGTVCLLLVSVNRGKRGLWCYVLPLTTYVGSNESTEIGCAGVVRDKKRMKSVSEKGNGGFNTSESRIEGAGGVLGGRESIIGDGSGGGGTSSLLNVESTSTTGGGERRKRGSGDNHKGVVESSSTRMNHKKINGHIPKVGDVIQIKNLKYPVRRLEKTGYVDDNGEDAYYIYLVDKVGARTNNYLVSFEEEYSLISEDANHENSRSSSSSSSSSRRSSSRRSMEPFLGGDGDVCGTSRKSRKISGSDLYKLVKEKYSNMHPTMKLPWLVRAPLTDVRCVRANVISLRVHVVPAFQVSDMGEIFNDGFCLGHGIWNYDSLGRNEDAYLVKNRKEPYAGSSTAV